jgi:hypothetical protein
MPSCKKTKQKQRQKTQPNQTNKSIYRIHMGLELLHFFMFHSWRLMASFISRHVSERGNISKDEEWTKFVDFPPLAHTIQCVTLENPSSFDTHDHEKRSRMV